MKVLVADAIHEAGKELLKEVAEVDDAIKLTPEQLLKKVSDADAIVVRSATKVTKEVIDAGKKLKVIGRAGMGVDNIDLEAATARGIIVVNAPEATSITVAEHTMGLMLAMARKIPFAYGSMKAGKWEKKRFMGAELRDKVLGVLGLGRIGSEVVKRARAFGMKIQAFDPYVSEKSAKDLGVELVEFEKLISTSDFVTIHVPLTEHTKKLIGKKELSKMKKDAILINCARGGIVDEAALYEALKSGKMGGAALDVFEKEPLEDSPLAGLENVILTPHLGASTEEAQRYASLIVCEEVLKVLENVPPRNVVNMPVLAPEVMEELKDYLLLAEGLGRFVSQLVSGYVRDVSVTYCGSLVEVEELNLLTNGVLVELLAPVLANEVNILNSSVIAKNRGIRVTEGRREDAGRYGNLIILKVSTTKEDTEAKGTLLGGEEARIVEVDGYEVDLVPKGHILLVIHEDRPGMIGKVATALGERKINIGSMQVGRKAKGGVQLMVLTLDQGLAREDREAIAGLGGIEKVGMAEL
ncbi:MAG: phosphoglycerate dehydrogenase [Candidatus Hydrothermarchaeaceae archaeon]